MCMYTQVSPSGPDGQPVGLDLFDCGKCLYCLDKPRFGGKGTKRQKYVKDMRTCMHIHTHMRIAYAHMYICIRACRCVNKKTPSVGPAKAWASLRITNTRELSIVEEYSNREVRSHVCVWDPTIAP